MEIELKIADEKDAQLWDRIVDSSSQGTLFHTWKWLKIAEKYTGTRLYPILGFKGTVVIGILPIFYMKKFGISSAFSPPPSTAIPYLGPVIENYDNYKQSKKESMDKNFQRNADHFISTQLHCGFTFLSLTANHDPRPYKWANYQLDPIFDYHIDITRDIESIWQNMDANLKGHIKRTEKNGIYIENGSKNDLIDIYNSLVRRYREQKRSVTVSKDYLTELYDTFSPINLQVFVAKQNGDTVGGIITLSYKDRVLYWIGGAKPASVNFSPNDLAQWEAIKFGHSRGYKIYEEIGAGTERLAEFKAKYNPKLVHRYSVKKYSSFIYQCAEKGYSHVIKRIIGKLV
jgi:lipid II:glycine glycyltransferase (peptidoglycan interpeptide bridge formation enzyme)